MTMRADGAQIASNGVNALGGFYGYAMKSGLPAELIELVYLYVSQINNHANCRDMHAPKLTEKDVTVEKFTLVQTWVEAGHSVTERERAALAWAKTMTYAPKAGMLEEAFHAASAVFTEKQFVNLTIAIKIMNAYAKMTVRFPQTGN